MSSFNFFSSSSGVPLYNFSTLHTYDILFSSHIGSLNGSYLFSSCKSDIYIGECGNNIIKIHWGSYRFINIISYFIEPLLVPQLNDVISLIDTILSLFSSSASLICPFFLTESSIRSVNRFTKILESFISPGEYLSLASGIFMEISNLYCPHKEYLLIFQSSFVCLNNQHNLCFSSNNWNTLNKYQQIIIMNLVRTLQPFSLIDIPVYLHDILSEPLRLFSIHLSDSFQFIGLFGSEVQVETFHSILKDFRSRLFRIHQPTYPLTSITGIGHLCIGILSINSFSHTYSYSFYPNSLISDRFCLKMLLIREYYIFTRALIHFNQLLSPFNEKYTLDIRNSYISYNNISVFIDYNCNTTNVLLLSKFVADFTHILTIKLGNFIHFNDEIQ